MRFSLHVIFTAFLVAVVYAGREDGREAPSRVRREALTPRGLSGAACPSGDPLKVTGQSSEFVYTEECESVSVCSGTGGGGWGTPYKGFCPGGADNQCCVISACSSPYTNSLCWDKSRVTDCKKWVPGHCPGPAGYECCTEF